MVKSPTEFGRKLSDIAVPSRALETLPDSMQRAVRLMLAGAGATAVYGIFSIIVAIVDKNDLITSNGKKITNGQLASGIVESVLITVILAAIWVLMARMSQRGRNWARITSSVLFVLWSFYTFESIGAVTASVAAIIYVVLVLAIWVIGLGALFMLWRQESSAFFRAKG